MTATLSQCDTVTPNDIIESMTGRRHLSWSQLSTFRGCPRKWHFSHVENAERDFVASSLLFGSAFHSAVQHHYQEQLAGLDVSNGQLQEVFSSEWQQQSEQAQVDIKYGKGESHDSLHELAGNMRSSFAESELAKPDGSIIAVEETITGSVHTQMPDMTARVDVIWQQDDGLHVTDIKTARSRWSQSKVNESADQLHLYSTMTRQMAPDEDVHLHFGIITKAKSPAVQLLDVPGAELSDESDNVLDLMLPVWNAMKAGVDYANPNPMNCSTCPYAHLCPAADGE